MTRRVLKWAAVFSLPITLLLIRLYPLRPLRDLVPQSTTMWSVDDELLRATLASDGQYRLWTPLNEMSTALVDAFRLKEDRWFYWHLGVNPFSLVRAAIKTWRAAVARAVPRSPCNSPGCYTTSTPKLPRANSNNRPRPCGSKRVTPSAAILKPI